MTDLTSHQLVRAILRSLDETAKHFVKAKKPSIRASRSVRASARKKASSNGARRKRRA